MPYTRAEDDFVTAVMGTNLLTASPGDALTDAAGSTFSIRTAQRTPAGEYALAFSGVVAGYTLPDEEFESQVERRLIPNGEYTWSFTAQAVDDQETAAADTRDVTRAYTLLDHATRDGVEGFVTITGGKWTTYRQMAQVTVDQVCAKLGTERPCRTHLEALPGPFANEPHTRDRVEIDQHA